MDSVSFHATTQLENKLSGIYEILYKKKSKIAGRINSDSEVKKSHNAHLALLLHITLNVATITGLYYLLY